MDVAGNNAVETELNDFISEGGSLAMLKNISEAELEKIYAVAYDFYESGKYQDAESLFQVLCILNHYDSRFFLALGACRQHQEHYHQALETYSYASLMSPSDPRFPFHAGECLLHMKEFSTAKQAFAGAQLLAKTQPGYESLAEKAGVMLTSATEQAEAGNAKCH
ncbi:SycD/LcrH family type III secretion system chaperone [Morganella psychrotolerans]|uniref:CesD/SycD/LcrH family type III secretion system chaperone n=1 Tax=Morganella psychrotolerans TaxID=368603 RepID=A0A5M9RB14_9GAMM|nr:SycD/LcrH family type III secretion system chaperone [Morganella psychrotolerans]KAA8717811.1 CesD/SycD/LcrH family type III secretion system chaperone [Morganella psychrotolerans]OBU07956.1 CesD/SycD/LcrH family type III secretion system chaperone [Morganella psychrotolerans]